MGFPDVRLCRGCCQSSVAVGPIGTVRVGCGGKRPGPLIGPSEGAGGREGITSECERDDVGRAVELEVVV